MTTQPGKFCGYFCDAANNVVGNLNKLANDSFVIVILKEFGYVDSVSAEFSGSEFKPAANFGRGVKCWTAK